MTTAPAEAAASPAPGSRCGVQARPREMLITAAAQHWNVSPDTCKAQNGGVLHGARKQFLTYGELVGDASKLPVPDLNTVPLKNSDDFTIVGHDRKLFEAAAKSTGAAKFGIDSRMPGMQYAVIARCPVFGGKVAKFDATKAKAVPGVRDVISIDAVGQGAFTSGGIVVLANNSWAAIQGRKALNITWDEGPNASESSESLRRHFIENVAKPGKIVRNEGDAEAALSSASKKIEVAYELPFAPHACMEPMNCTVHIRPDGAEAWVPTQAPQWAQGVIAQVSGLPPEKVDVHTTLMGGGFGRRYQADFVMEAAQVAKATGKPVQVLWTRRASWRRGSIFRAPRPSPRFGTKTARKNRRPVSLALRHSFPTRLRISALNTRWRIPAFRARGGAPSSIPAAALLSSRSWTNSRQPRASIL